MKADEIASAVQKSAGIDTHDHADRAVRATLTEEGPACTPEQARQHARAVTAALREAVGAEYRHLLSQLPKDYADLLHTENVQH